MTAPPGTGRWLSEANRRVSSPKRLRLLAVCVFGAALLSYVLPPAMRGDLTALPQLGDGPDYDAIALQLSKGRGFSYDLDDPDYRAPYLRGNESGRYDELLQRHGAGMTTYRPPLLPFVMASSFRVFGRAFWPIRVLNGLCMALAAALTFVMLSRRFGGVPGVLSSVWFLGLDPRFRDYAGLVLTEAQAVLAATLICWWILRTVETSGNKAAIALGAMMGIAFLARSIFFLWTPFIVIAIYALARPRAASWLSRSAIYLPALVLLSLAAVSAPWMIRNCIVLRSIEPLGTMGSTNLPEAFGDEAFARRGIWSGVAKKNVFESLHLENESPLEQEKIMANYSRQAAVQWVSQHPSKALLLTGYKIQSLWKPNRPSEALLLASGSLGWICLLVWRPRAAMALLAVLAACTSAVAITWDVGEGRFLMPVLPALSLLSGLGVWCILLLLEIAVARVTTAAARR